jgi:hypothetical protein
MKYKNTSTMKKIQCLSHKAASIHFDSDVETWSELPHLRGPGGRERIPAHSNFFPYFTHYTRADEKRMCKLFPQTILPKRMITSNTMSIYPSP